MSLRVLHVTPYSEAAWAYGGIPRVVSALTRALARRGHHVTVCATDVLEGSRRLTPDRSTYRRRLRPWPASRTAGVELRIFPNVSNRAAYHGQLFVPLGFREYLARHAGDFDVGHLHACRNIPGVLASRALRAAGVPYVVAPNGTAPAIERRLYAKRIFDRLFGDRMLKDAARILAVSDAERGQLHGLGVADEAIRHVPNPIDLDEFARPIERGAFRAGQQIGDGPLVLFLGKITPRKNVDVLVRAFARLTRRDATLVIAGNDMGALERVRGLVSSLKLDGCTRFVGLLEGAKRLEALADADVVVYPSEHEVFGLVALEALMLGTPVVVAGDSGCGEVVSASGGGVLVPTGDVERLSESVEQVLGAVSFWRSAAVRAGVHIRARYSSEVVCSQLETVYMDAIAPDRRAVPA